MYKRTILGSIFLVLILTITFVFSSFCLISCSKTKQKYVDYTKDNNYIYAQTSYIVNTDAPEIDQYGAEIYTPIEAKPKYGLIFFVGTMIAPNNYKYLSAALAQKGFLVVIPKVTLAMTYLYYEEQTSVIANKTMNDFPDVKFFVGGHSQGGGACMRFAADNQNTLLGAIFMSPLCYGEYEVEINGTTSMKFDTLVNSTLPAMLLEASGDEVLTTEMRADAESRMPQNYTHYVINPGAHMSFSEWDDDATLNMFNGDGHGITEDQKAAQKQTTLVYTFNFINSIINK